MFYKFEERRFPSHEPPGCDLAPKGRDETNLPFTMSRVKHHDRYEG